MKQISVLIPTYNRPEALAVTLTSLCFQIEKDFDIIISDQSPSDVISKDVSIQTVISLLENKGNKVLTLRNIPPKGLAQQRQFLLDRSHTKFSFFIDDDLILEPYVMRNLKKVLEEEGCGFAGSAVIGLSYKNDVRPHQQNVEFWEGDVQPEIVLPKGLNWERYQIHNAANILHLQEKFRTDPDSPKKYKVAWVGGCVMYDTAKLRNVGGFGFWKELPQNHCGEDVLAQLRIMKRYGGCGVLPSGVYHQELETTVQDREINAPEYLQI